MKITAVLLLTLLYPSMLLAQDAGIRVLNPSLIEVINDENIYHFYQGQTILIALDDDLKDQGRSWWIQALIPGHVYDFNQNGIAFVGINMGTEPGEYPICLEMRCSDTDRKNELRIRIFQTEFPKTRTSAYAGEPRLRRDKQKNAIDDAFGRNRGEEDLTNSSFYVDPLDIPREISDPFGFIYGNNKYRAHGGTDLKARVGTPVRAVNRGKVIMVAKMFRNEGNMVIISHGLDIFSVYMHLSKFGTVETVQKTKSGKIIKKGRQLKVGDMVERGQRIGFSGTTGSGAKRIKHLHWGMRIKNTYVDPIYFIDTVNKYLP